MAKVLAYPGCPTLAYMIAMRVTNPLEDADAFISFTGRKGSSKSTSSSALCEDLAENIARLRGKGEPPEKFFSIKNIRTITRTGALDLLSSGVLKKENSVFLLDDAGTQWAARKFSDPLNILLGQILQICRIYRCVIVANFIMAKHIDLYGRQMTDFRAIMLYKNVKEGQAFFKFFYIEQGENGQEYKKYLRWHGKRIRRWVVGKPSAEFERKYKIMRREETDKFCEEAKTLLDEVNGQETLPKVDHRVKNYATHPKVLDIRDAVLRIRNDPDKTKREKTDTAIARALATTRYWVGMVK